MIIKKNKTSFLTEEKPGHFMNVIYLISQTFDLFNFSSYGLFLFTHLPNASSSHVVHITGLPDWFGCLNPTSPCNIQDNKLFSLGFLKGLTIPIVQAKE